MFYFIINESRTKVKIGKSQFPEKRLKQLQTGTDEKLFLYGTAPGDKIEEQDLHRRFAPYRLRGEWFSFPPIEVELQEIVSEDRKIRPDKTYPVWEFKMITGLTEAEIQAAERKASRAGIVRFGCAGFGEWDCLRDMPGRIRGWVWCKMEQAGCVEKRLF
jgi:hypothetical protein